LESFEKSKEKLVPQIETCKQALLQKREAAWHGRLETYSLCYQADTVKWQTDRFSRAASCEAIQWNKFWNKKIHRRFRSHFKKY